MQFLFSKGGKKVIQTYLALREKVINPLVKSQIDRD